MLIMDEELVDWLRLIRTPSIGPITFWNLYNQVKDIKKAIKLATQLSKRSGKKLIICPKEKVYEEIENGKKRKINWIIGKSPDYPSLLSFLPDAPPVLSCLGNSELLKRPCLGIVGSRNASLIGKKMAYTLSKELSSDFIIVSGFARGIDASAHESALEQGTIGVLAGGVDQIYPSEQKRLYDQIIEKGLFISEMPLGLFPAGQHFPKRNRLISGLSQGVIVIEAAIRSGSLITARCALEQGREVFAVPGCPLDPRYEGTNSLIKKGAILVEKAQDVRDNLNNFKITLKDRMVLKETILRESITEDAFQVDDMPKDLSEKILKALSLTPLSIDSLKRAFSEDIAFIPLVLLELELAEKVKRLPGNYVVRLA
ncbi:MAG: DNA-protecting protein DprA [Proteobacteria bacterium]|nr:DNA-protecting protein DprA [Pseudomonadota bacterium]